MNKGGERRENPQKESGDVELKFFQL